MDVPDDYVHIDDAVRIVLENGWLSEEDIAKEISEWKEKAFQRLKKLLEEKGIEIRRLPKNPSLRQDARKQLRGNQKSETR
jgi:hypothetical protein